MNYRPTRAPGLFSDAMAQQAETRLTGRLIKHLRSLPRCHARKVHGSRYQDKGEPDIDGCLRGRALKIEVKVVGNVPTPLQYKRMRDWQAAGALAGWVTSEAELDALLAHADDPEWQNPQLIEGVDRRPRRAS